MSDAIPTVCFIEDVCRILRISRRALERARQYGVFPIRELPALDGRPRWAGEDVRKYLEHRVTSSRIRRVG